MVELAALSNALTDVLAEVSFEELKEFGLTKGYFHDTSQIPIEKILERLSDRPVKLIPGGSPANVVFSAAKLGIQTGLLGTVGNDEYGKGYLKALNDANIDSLVSTVEGKSGLCFIMLTPDGEKTTFSVPYMSGQYSYDLKQLEETKILHTSGYELITNPKRTIETIEYAFSFVGAKISFDMADPGIIEPFLEEIGYVLSLSDILFLTQEEAAALAQDHPNQALNKMSKLCEVVVLKKGKHGSVVRHGEIEHQIPIYPVDVVNTNGAGDAYTAGFLSARLRGKTWEECGHEGSKVAARVCGLESSHL